MNSQDIQKRREDRKNAQISLRKDLHKELDEESNRILPYTTCTKILEEKHPHMHLELETLETLLDVADKFVENVTNWASQFAKHRKSNTIEPKDIQLELERSWNIFIPSAPAATQSDNKQK